MSAIRILALQISVCLLCFNPSINARAQEAHELRTWTDSTGQHKTVAQFVELRGTNVSLKLENGQVIQVALENLSSDDRKLARQAAKASKPKPADRPVVNASNDDAGTTTNVATSDWTQWRGPNRDGISSETGLLQSWPDGGPPVAFQSEGLGSGFSSVAIAAGRLFTMGKFGDETRLLALNANDGNLLWQTPVGNGGDGPNCTPTVDGDLVYAVSFAGDLLCAEASTGNVVWRTSFPNDFGGRMMSSWGYSESPLVDGDHLIVTPGAPNAALAALEKKTGRVVWRTPMPANPGQAGQDGAGYSSVVISHARGVKQYIQFMGRGIISVDAKTGQFLWGYNRIANGTANIPTPIVSDDLVFCSSGYDDGGSALLRVTGARNQLSVSEVWYKRANELQNHHGGMILLGDHVFMGHGHNNGFPVCFDLKTGRDRWRPGRGAGTGSAAITYADGRFYFRYENGTMALIDTSADDYFERGRFRIAINNGQSWPHPVVSDGKLYLRDQHQLIVYNIRRP
jgi:outer membrane protein assembly factor BamB